MLQVNGLNIYNPNKGHLVKNLSFHVGMGTTLGIVGESGSGKSLTALSIMRLLPHGLSAEAEKVDLAYGNSYLDILKIPEKKMQSIRGNSLSMVFQEPMTSLNPAYTCGNQVSEIITKHGMSNPSSAKNYAINLFNEVKLPRPREIYSSYPHQLSGGQRQRVMIAMAISCNPSLLIADEPTTALDVTVQKSILDLLLSLKEKFKMSMIFISHDFSVIKSIVDHVLVMRDGEKVEYNEVQQILHHPKAKYSRALLACRPSNYQVDRPLKLPTINDFDSKDKDFAIKYINQEERKKQHQDIYRENPTLVIKDLSVKFRINKGLFSASKQYVHAVKQVSFGIWKGETVGLVGESGCGKTTLGRTILKLVNPSSGKISYKGKPLSAFTRKELQNFREKFQIIFQDPYSSLNPKFTVRRSLLEPLLVHGIVKNKREGMMHSEMLLEQVNLEKHFINNYVHELSGGQRQRVVIARALAMNPEYIICDESVAALDVSVQAQIINLLNRIKQERNLTYLFISHDLSVVRYMSDRILVMREGHIEEEGESDKIFFSPETAYTKKLLASILQ